MDEPAALPPVSADYIRRRLRVVSRRIWRPHKIVTAGRRVLVGTTTDTASGVIDDVDGNKHRVVLPGLVVPGLGHNIFLLSQAAKTGRATVIGSRPRL